LLAAGCANTIRGAGRDISNATDATADAVDEIAN
jgi:predicted small secreted protein